MFLHDYYIELYIIFVKKRYTTVRVAFHIIYFVN
nr:MAG TPA: hypothetical protein [Caudoviricetes sp.]